MRRKKKNHEKPENQGVIVEHVAQPVCEHLITSEYEKGITTNNFCPAIATHEHGNKKLCEKHWHWHVKGVVQWEEYSECGGEEHGEEKIDVVADIDEKPKKKKRRWGK